MEPPARMDSESLRDEKVKVLKAIPPLEADGRRSRPVPRLPRGARRRRRFAGRDVRRASGSTSIRGDGRASRSTSAPASASR